MTHLSVSFITNNYKLWATLLVRMHKHLAMPLDVQVRKRKIHSCETECWGRTQSSPLRKYVNFIFYYNMHRNTFRNPPPAFILKKKKKKKKKKKPPNLWQQQTITATHSKMNLSRTHVIE